MIQFARNNTGPISQWWWTVDRWVLAAFLTLITLGILLSLAASPAVADKLNIDDYHFVKRHLLVLPVALTLMFGFSLLSPKYIKLAALLILGASLLLLLLTFFFGVEIKGARRWLPFFGFSLQPSEFIKPSFAVVAAWLFSESFKRPQFQGHKFCILLWLAIFGLLVLQPDLGMATVVSLVWGFQFFLAGLKMYLVLLLGAAAIALTLSAYFLFPHFSSRIDRFLDPASGDTYQVQRSMEAFINGGFLGQGPGEGTVKNTIPDVHADFVFAVAGEEFGLIAASAIVAIFGFIVLRGLSRLRRENDLFLLLAVAGLLTQFGLQAIVNLASTVNLMPTKGMTLPFISYGGSSLLAVAINAGMILSLTRKRHQPVRSHVRQE